VKKVDKNWEKKSILTYILQHIKNTVFTKKLIFSLKLLSAIGRGQGKTF